MEDEGFWIGLLAAPNVTIQRKLYDDAGLARLIRDGVKHDGHGVDTMPCNAFHHANDKTIADVIAFVRSVPGSGELQPKIQYGPLARWNFLTGEWKLAPEEIDRKGARIGDENSVRGAPTGRYMLTAFHARGGMGEVWRCQDANIGRESLQPRRITNLMRTGEAAVASSGQ
jgi:hypothetical protein